MDTPVLVIEEGAVIEGQVTMNAAKAKEDKKGSKKNSGPDKGMDSYADLGSSSGGDTPEA